MIGKNTEIVSFEAILKRVFFTTFHSALDCATHFLKFHFLDIHPAKTGQNA